MPTVTRIKVRVRENYLGFCVLEEPIYLALTFADSFICAGNQIYLNILKLLLFRKIITLKWLVEDVCAVQICSQNVIFLLIVFIC